MYHNAHRRVKLTKPAHLFHFVSRYHDSHFLSFYFFRVMFFQLCSLLLRCESSDSIVLCCPFLTVCNHYFSTPNLIALMILPFTMRRLSSVLPS